MMAGWVVKAESREPGWEAMILGLEELHNICN